MTKKSIQALIFGLAGLSLLSLGTLSGFLLGRDTSPATTQPGLTPTVTALPAADIGGGSVLEAYQQAYRNLAQRLVPTVVKIQTTTMSDPRSSENFPFRFFFEGQPQPSTPQEQVGFGSGIMFEQQGNSVFVITNHHVINGAQALTVITSDNKEWKAELVGSDERRDIAVVKFTAEGRMPLASFGNSDAVQAGDIVFAIGSPYGIQNTITQGIVSAVGRTSTDFRATGGIGTNFTDFIQTDAAINQGNSGGALVNIQGQVVGINTWIASRNGGNVGLAFAVPINNAARTARDLLDKGKVEYGWLGVSGLDLSPEDLRTLGLERRQGAFVGSIIWDSPAGKAGIRPGDLITRFDTSNLSNANDLVRAVSGRDPKATYTLTILRDGRTREIRVTLGVRDDTAINRSGTWPGFVVTGTTEALRARNSGTIAIGTPMITTVDENSAANDAGIRQFDAISSINGKAIRDLRDFYRELAAAQDKDLELGLVNARSGREITVKFRP